MATSPLKLRWFSDWQDLQDIRWLFLLICPSWLFFIRPYRTGIALGGACPLPFAYHSLTSCQNPPRAILSPHNSASGLHRYCCHGRSIQLGEDHDSADGGRPQDIGTTYRAYRA